MALDPRESINNMGTIRVDLLDGADLPAADRNGYSDPYCKFMLNGKEVFKSSEQKRTLNPVWRQYFEAPISSRIGADFKVTVWDWDAVGNDDFLGEAKINLELLEPLTPREYKLPLEGKSGMIRIRILFRPAYVIRSRQSSSTFSGGTLAAPARAVSGMAGAPMKGVGMVGSGMAKGASFFKDGFKVKKREGRSSETAESEEITPTSQARGDHPLPPPPSSRDSAAAAAQNGDALQPPATPKTPTGSSSAHARTTSFGGRSVVSMVGGSRSGASGHPEVGTATITILAAAAYPTDTKVRVHIKQLTAKGLKDVHKTKALHPPAAGPVQWESEACRVHCSPDTQFQLVVKDHSAFRSMGLGEATFTLGDSPPGGVEKTIKVGAGSVVLRTSFTPPQTSAGSPSSIPPVPPMPTIDSLTQPDGGSGGRHSFLNRSPVG